ncbi:unnamed protein product [Pieris brassicae]|uniref:Uncharacterized protein n=1 Tax=Pieris brassicae TaxID=7116 RepID=A0A9P0XIZ6_PIEBR|nr:unnamed protein product [Pieris brassicae]
MQRFLTLNYQDCIPSLKDDQQKHVAQGRRHVSRGARVGDVARVVGGRAARAIEADERDSSAGALCRQGTQSWRQKAAEHS